MYSIGRNEIKKKLETWEIIIPQHDNEKIFFEKDRIDSILNEFSINFPGYTIINCLGIWKDQKQQYRDENLQIIIDIFPVLTENISEIFLRFKKTLAEELKQEKIYITKKSDKEEILSLDEFFKEIGIEINNEQNSESAKRELAIKLINRQDFVLQRLGYETVLLRRIKRNGKKLIYWERKLCGIIIKSEFDDYSANDAVLCGADQLDAIGEALFSKNEIVIVGDYEYQQYILEKFNYRPILNVIIPNINNNLGFLNQRGEEISTKHFIELFSMTVFINYVVLKESGFLEDEIKINIGADGSLQIGENLTHRYIFHSPAKIPFHDVQGEIMKCVKSMIALYDSNDLEPIAFLQARVRNFYIKKKACLKVNMKTRNSNKS